jgi:protein-S-isoprenylcysteine O-methyltransferase Ste14
MARTLSLIVRNLLFTIVVPGAGGVYVPWLILTRHGASPAPAAWYAAPVIVIGISLYLSCVWAFAVAGQGTPGPWDAPRRFVAAGPYRWVRNPIYIAALLIVSGEAWLFLSVDLLLYAGGLAVAFHLLVIGYEEPRLRARFGEEYDAYRRTVSRWIPRPSHASANGPR